MNQPEPPKGTEHNPPPGFRIIPREWLEAGNKLPKDALFWSSMYVKWQKSAFVCSKPPNYDDGHFDTFCTTQPLPCFATPEPAQTPCESPKQRVGKEVIELRGKLNRECANHDAALARIAEQCTGEEIGQLRTERDTLARQLDAMKEQLDASEADRRRLDWLQSNWEQVFQRISADGFFYFDKAKERHERRPTLRAAIDAATEKEAL